jgi:predicted AAA+ superfamily ATPase
MRAALFSPLKANDQAMGALAETAIFSQWFHQEFDGLYYARWNDGEVDLVAVEPSNQKAMWAVEVKWSDRFCDNPGELKNVISFCRSNGLEQVRVTSKTRSMSCETNSVKVHFVPASVYCYTVAFNIIHSKQIQNTA